MTRGSSPSIGVFGGSFNPPHVGHVLAVTYALSVHALDEVLCVPVYRHPFAKELAPFEDRVEMCRLAMAPVVGARVSTVEQELGGESLTLRTLEQLRETNPSWRLRLIIGADVVADLPKWHRWDRIVEIAQPIVLGRAGIDDEAAEAAAPDDSPAAHPAIPDVFLPEVSSTDVRQRLGRGGGALDRSWLAQRVPARVLEHIASRRLYCAPARTAGGETPTATEA